jgi:hypothetical protein
MTDIYHINPDYAQRLLADAIGLHGPMTHGQPVPAAQLAALKGHLPDLLLALWSTYGTGDLMGGRLRICQPHQFDALLDFLFAAEPDMTGACHAFAVNPFGELLVWHEAHWLIHVSPVRGWVLAPQMLHPDLKDDPNKLFYESVLMADPSTFDLFDVDGQPLFDRALAGFGPLPPDHIWGLLPIPPAPEDVKIENLRLVDAQDYLGEVVGELTLMLQDFEGDRFNLRGFGGI